MKKAFALILFCTIILSATGCKPKQDKPQQNPTTSAQTSTTTSDKTSDKTSEQPPAKTSDETSSETSSREETVPAQAAIIDAVLFDDEKLLSFDKFENESTGWGQGVRFDDINRPVTCDPAQEKYGESGGLFIMPADEKKMYLTFDEGYENGYTAQILDALKEKNAPAVFFVTMPYVKSNPDLIKRMIDEGHIVGNHTVRHKAMPSLTTAEVIEEIAGLHNYMVENYNYQMTLMRPPEGKFSTRTMEIAKALGYKTVLWSFAYYDYDPANQMGVEKALPKVTERAHNGAIFLLHAVSKDNAEMMGDVIDSIRSKGIEFGVLQETKPAE